MNHKCRIELWLRYLFRLMTWCHWLTHWINKHSIRSFIDILGREWRVGDRCKSLLTISSVIGYPLRPREETYSIKEKLSADPTSLPYSALPTCL